MKKIFLLPVLTLFVLSCSAQLSIMALGTPFTVDFTGFTGAGFQPGGGGGTLDSYTWSVTGLSDGDSDFGATSITGDFAKGVTGGLVTNGGIYGVDIAGNQGLMVQPTADDFTAGSFILRTKNATGSDIGEIDLAYTIYVLNDAGRSNSFNLSYSYDNVTYTDVPDLNYNSPEAIDLTPYVTYQNITLLGLNIPSGEVFYLRWTSDDVSGAGSRDEFALDDINITATEAAGLEIATFNTGAVTVDENIGFVLGEIDMTESTDCLLDISINGASTADATDVPFTPFGLLLSPGDPDFYLFNIPVNDDIILEGDETFILDLTYVSGTCAVGLPDQFVITITDNETPPPPVYTAYDIVEVTQEDVDGNALSSGELVDLTGIVYGVNLWDGGLQFTLIDNTGGISVFSFDNDFGYAVTEGDEVNILGVITQFNGLTEVEADTLIYIDGGNSLKSATYSTDLNEGTESDLILLELNGYFLVDEAQWLGDGTSFNVEVSNGGNTYVIRIDDNTELSSASLTDIHYFGPEISFFMLTGIGSQFDSDAPYTSGYQIMPRYISDFNILYESISQLDPSQINIYPNPATNNLTLSGKENILTLEIIDNMGRSVEIMEVNNLEKTISVLDLPAGFYGLKIKTETGIYASGFIKQ